MATSEMSLREVSETQGAFCAQGIDGSAIPAATKSALRSSLAALQKTLLDQQKAAGAANKARATATAVEVANAAAAAGQKFVVAQLEVWLLKGSLCKGELEFWERSAEGSVCGAQES